MAGKQGVLKPGPVVTGGTLRYVARGMLPFYRKIACSKRFAEAWSCAVVKADLDAMKQLLLKSAPCAAKQGLGTNGIGYFISFSCDGGKLYYSSGTTIPPGTARFTFPPAAHRQIAAAVQPFYRELAVNHAFADAVALSIRRGDRKALVCMVRSLVKSRGLRSVRLEDEGVVLQFKPKCSRYAFRHLLIRDYY